ncbi:SH2 domain-containing protein, partial [Pisolithus croceorrhizus]
AETDRTRWVIKHPNFHNFHATQAKNFLEKQQCGDVVICPSSKGMGHLAVTWKVDDKLTCINILVHITEINTPSRLILAVDDKYQYTDLDELIVNHVQVIMCKVKELMAHKKFKCGPKDELYLSLKKFVAANPAKSAYGFMLNCQKPAHFNLCFLANKNATVQNWVCVLLAIGYAGSLPPQPMHVTPESYCLFEAPVTGIPELCDAFKVRCIT